MVKEMKFILLTLTIISLSTFAADYPKDFIKPYSIHSKGKEYRPYFRIKGFIITKINKDNETKFYIAEDLKGTRATPIKDKSYETKELEKYINKKVDIHAYVRYSKASPYWLSYTKIKEVKP